MVVEWTDFNKMLTADTFKEITKVSDKAILVVRKDDSENERTVLLNCHNTASGKTWTINDHLYYEYFDWIIVVKYCPLYFDEQLNNKK